MKKWIIVGASAGGVIVLAVIILMMTRSEEKPHEAVKIEAPAPPDPRIARIAQFARQVEDAESKGEFKDALFALKQLAILDPKDPRIAAAKPRLEDLVRRLEAWEAAQREIELEKKVAQRQNSVAAWQKVLDLCEEAKRQAPTERQRNVTQTVEIPTRQSHAWARARDEEAKGNLAVALERVGEAISLAPASAELTAYKADLEKKQRKKEFDRSAAAARAEPVPVKAYELWMKARTLAEDRKDVDEAEGKIDALKPWVDPAERERRYTEAMKSGEAALKAGTLEEAGKAFKQAEALKPTELAPKQGLARVSTAEIQRNFEKALADVHAAEEKKEWADAMEAYDRAVRIRPGDSKLAGERRKFEEAHRPPKITLILSEVNGIKAEFVLIKRGSFLMGDPDGLSDEKPHSVAIPKDFWMQTTEVTQAQWAAVVDTKPWMSQSNPNLPVEGVSWEDSQKYFEKLNPRIREQVEGRRASLPTEAEWEYACRAGARTRWSFGNDESQFDQFGWSSKSGVKGPQQVAQKSPNAWGLFDMQGNVAEWCSDPYGAVDEKLAPDSVLVRCLRGGSWNDRPASCRASSRGKEQSSTSNLFIGFRMILR